MFTITKERKMSATVAQGQCFTLDSSRYNLSRVTMSFGWDLPQQKNSLWGSWFSDAKYDYEIDVITLLCGMNGKICDLGSSELDEPSFKDSDVIFFNNLRHHTGHVWLGGGAYYADEQHEDAEQVFIHLNTLEQKYTRLVFMLQLYDAVRNDHDLSQLKKCYVRMFDADGQPIVKFQLDDLTDYQQQRSMVMVELLRMGDRWVFKPIAQSSRSDSFIDWLQYYV